MELVKYEDANKKNQKKKKKKKKPIIRVYVLPFFWRNLTLQYPLSRNFCRTEKICSYLTKYFEKAETLKLGGILLISDCPQHLETIRTNFSNEFSMLLITSWFKQKELIFDLKQKKKFVLTTYDDVCHNLDYLGLLNYIDTIFFATPPTNLNAFELVQTLLISYPQRKNCSIIDFVDDESRIKEQFKKRAEFYKFYNMRIKFES